MHLLSSISSEAELEGGCGAPSRWAKKTSLPQRVIRAVRLLLSPHLPDVDPPRPSLSSHPGPLNAAPQLVSGLPASLWALQILSMDLGRPLFLSLAGIFCSFRRERSETVVGHSAGFISALLR